mmetsp:Transcript_3125/g.6478  ORF Transcript_3125/g.6478 Transcript_3125/m.6478 type:complete len:137 (+) Transcript_3125:946-1356(+)
MGGIRFSKLWLMLSNCSFESEPAKSISVRPLLLKLRQTSKGGHSNLVWCNEFPAKLRNIKLLKLAVLGKPVRPELLRSTLLRELGTGVGFLLKYSCRGKTVVLRFFSDANLCKVALLAELGDRSVFMLTSFLGDSS